MLTALCGNKSIQKILIFLFVNGKCYGTQLHRWLKTPLTPIQKALMRLEKGGIILSFTEGKTKIYQFNPAYPLITELEQLLKRAYTLLPPHEKREYYVPKEELTSGTRSESKARILQTFWEKLATVKHITFHAKSKSKEDIGWNGTGNGDVQITRAGSTVIIYTEKGHWKGHVGSDTAFRNVFRWTLDRHAGMISLEHLRHGEENPVFLFYLAPTSPTSLSSVDSHLCEGDTYFGQIYLDHHSLRLNWRIIGPKKNEEIDYYYST